MESSTPTAAASTGEAQNTKPKRIYNTNGFKKRGRGSSAVTKGLAVKRIQGTTSLPAGLLLEMKQQMLSKLGLHLILAPQLQIDKGVHPSPLSRGREIFMLVP